MTDARWLRPLDEIENAKDRWLVYNPLFISYKGLFDRGFDQGFPLNLDYYVTRKKDDGTTFEEEMCSFLFSSHGSSTGKVYVLRGPVGSGKTCFVQYLRQTLLPQSLKESVTIHVDAWKLFDEKGREYETLGDAFRRAVEQAVTEDRHLFSVKEYYSGVLRNLGFQSKRESEIMEMGQYLQPNHILKFIVGLDQISHVLVVFDNIDDNPSQAIQAGSRFIWELANIMRGARYKKPSTVLVTVREYTANYFSDTAKFAIRDLPPVDESQVVQKKLEQTKDLISAETREVTHTVPWFAYSDETRQPSPQARTYTITKENSYAFLQRMSEYLLSQRESELLSLLRSLSAGNLKILIRNVYNILHSVKLPFFPLFDRVFSPTPVDLNRQEPLLPLEVACECLMAIHYPFYDVENSNLLNLFNATSSKAPMDFQNTLAIVRLLCFLSNVGKVTYEKIILQFENYGYELSYVKAALQKCLDHGVIRSSHGLKVDDLEPQSTEIQASPAATTAACGR
jgi:hypothetical protein